MENEIKSRENFFLGESLEIRSGLFLYNFQKLNFHPLYKNIASFDPVKMIFITRALHKFGSKLIGQPF